MRILTQKELNRFWGYVDKEKSTIFYNNTKCWEWTASCNSQGYGHINIGYKIEAAHRIAWFIVNGNIPDNLGVLHRCDNTLCVRIDHLFLGTHHENMRDKENKGRGNHASGDNHPLHIHPESAARGEEVGLSKLTWEQVSEIRRRYARWGIGGDSSITLAKEFGVVPLTIQRIVKFESWKK